MLEGRLPRPFPRLLREDGDSDFAKAADSFTFPPCRKERDEGGASEITWPSPRSLR